MTDEEFHAINILINHRDNTVLDDIGNEEAPQLKFFEGIWGNFCSQKFPHLSFPCLFSSHSPSDYPQTYHDC